MIQYDDALHRYSWKGDRYISATQLLEYVKNKFDVPEQSAGMADRHGQDSGYWAGKWQTETDVSLVVGNELHNRQEELALARGFEMEEGQVITVQNPGILNHLNPYDYYHWPPGIYPELILWNHQYRIAGRADRIKLYIDRRHGISADISDYKTNKRLRTKSWWDKYDGYRMLRFPLQHLMDCEMVHYTLQLSIYQWMLEEMGIYPGTRTILHFPPLPPDMGFPGQRKRKPNKYKIPYLRDEVLTLIQHVQSTKQA